MIFLDKLKIVQSNNMMIQIKKDSRDSKHITYQWMVDSLQISLAFKSTLDLMNCL